jgi:GNAT superfamily N-acetyltransferase
MPPPRQVVLELGEVRVRLGLEDGAVRMQVLGEDRGQGRDLLRAAEEALRERGFDLAGERGEGGRERPAEQQRPDLAPPRPGNGAAPGGRPADRPTGAGTRTAIHL